MQITSYDLANLTLPKFQKLVEVAEYALLSAERKAESAFGTEFHSGAAEHARDIKALLMALRNE